jgi:hypothetical protein
MDVQLIAVRIDHPIFAYSPAIEEFLLDPFVPASSALR